MSVNIPGMEDAECIMLFGYNPSASHPIVSRRVVKAKEKGAKILVLLKLLVLQICTCVSRTAATWRS